MSGEIFISYRRDDDPSAAARVRDGLAAKFGPANVFMDVDELLAGQRFDEELAKALAECDVLIAIIGPRWSEQLENRKASGERDYVREEIAGALERRIVVIPVRVGREGQLAPLPRQEDLPDDIRELVLHQKHDVTHEHFRRDVDKLVNDIRKVRGSSNKLERAASILRWAPGLVAAVGAVFVGIVGTENVKDVGGWIRSIFEGPEQPPVEMKSRTSAWQKKAAGVYIGKVISSGKETKIYTTFSEGGERGFYRYRNNDVRVGRIDYINGTLRSCTPQKDRVLTCEWIAEWREGTITATFDADFRSFNGTWVSETNKANNIWDGVRSTEEDVRQQQAAEKTAADLAASKSEADKAAMIKEAQTLLAELGYDPGEADGLRGVATTDAIKAFQRDMGTASRKIFGQVDQRLISALRVAKRTKLRDDRRRTREREEREKAAAEEAERKRLARSLAPDATSIPATKALGDGTGCRQLSVAFTSQVPLKEGAELCDATGRKTARVERIHDQSIRFLVNGAKTLTCREGEACAFDWSPSVHFRVTARSDPARGIQPIGALLPR